MWRTRRYRPSPQWGSAKQTLSSTIRQIRRRAGEDENSGADDRANAQRNQVKRPKGPLQTVFVLMGCLFHQHVERLALQKIRHSASSLLRVQAPTRAAPLRLDHA